MVLPLDGSRGDRGSTLREKIQTEIAAAQTALKDGNIGKARVCARRAVGKAFEISNHSQEISHSVGANEILKFISINENFPEEVRNAARRLSASVNETEISMKPVEDALTIIEELLRGNQ